MLKIGDKIPVDISILDSQGNETNLRKYLGKPLVIYFYPKDDTPGCTTEACEFRDFNSEIEKLGAKVIGISKDKPRSHTKFVEKYKLNFDILSDENHLLQDAFGVWMPKKFMGREFLGTVRSTFITDSSGVITHVWESVKAEGHAKEVFDVLSTQIAKKLLV